jgi:hypothetical protein
VGWANVAPLAAKFWAWLVENGFRLLAVAICAAVIYYFTLALLRDKRKQDTSSPSSFFSLDDLLSRRFFNAVGLFFAGSVALLYAAIALDAAACLTAAKNLLFGLLQDHIPKTAQADFSNFSKTIPSWLDPLVVLLIFLCLFASRVRALLVYARDLVLRASGLYSMIDSSTRDAAQALLAHFDGNFRRLEKELEVAYGNQEAPLLPEFVNKKEDNRIAYQLIWRNLDDIQANGLTSTMEALRKRIGVPPSDDGVLHINLTRLAAGITLFVVLLGLYVILAPLLRSAVPPPFDWPNPSNDGWLSTIRYVLKFTLAYVLPLAFAMNSYPIRRRAHRKEENQVVSFIVVATVQFLMAFLVHEVFNGIDASIAVATNQSYSFFSAKLHIAAFLYSLVPAIAFGTFLWLRSMDATSITVLFLISLSVAIEFGLCQLVYECHSTQFYHYYLYQAFLGFFISFFYFASASVME